MKQWLPLTAACSAPEPEPQVSLQSASQSPSSLCTVVALLAGLDDVVAALGGRQRGRGEAVLEVATIGLVGGEVRGVERLARDPAEHLAR